MQTHDDLSSVLARRKPGDEIELKVMRASKEQIAQVKLGEAPANPVVSVPPSLAAFLGVLSEALTAEQRQHLGVKTEHGVVVTHVLPGSPAAVGGLQRDDVIIHVGATAVSTQDQVRDAIRKAGAGTEVMLKVVRAKQEMDIKARLQPMLSDIDQPRVLPEPRNGQGHLLGGLGLLHGLERLPALENKVQELEKRIRELEQKLPR
jgi:S1-C subfamily serine protease